MEAFYFSGSGNNILISGPSQSGKTQLVFKMLTHEKDLFSPSISKVFWCYDHWQDVFSKLSLQPSWKGRILFHRGIPTEDMFKQSDGHTLVICDDLMMEAAGQDLDKIFTKKTHHTNTSFILCLQNIFLKHLRTVTLNAHYIILMRSLRDSSQIVQLAKQMYPGNNKFLVKSYRDATKEPYGYLVIDLKQETPDLGRIRTNIIPGEQQFIYSPW